MTFDFETYRNNGSLAMSGANKAGIFIEVLNVGGLDPNGSKAYPKVPGGYLYAVNIKGKHDFSVGTNASGQAEIAWVQRSSNSTDSSTFLIFARRINSTDTMGILLLNSGGDVMADMTHPVPQYGGSAQPAAGAAKTYTIPNGLQANVHQVTANIRPGTNRVVLLKMPDSGTSDIWYSCDSFIPANVTSDFTLNVTAYAPPGVPYQVPTLHVYSLDGPISGGSTYAIKFSLPNGQLVYDSSAENMSIAATALITYPAVGATATVAFPVLANPGISIPYFRRDDRSSSGYDVYLSAAKRVGGQVTFKTLHTEHRPPTPVMLAGGQEGASTNSYCIMVDLSQLSGASVSGVPSANVQSFAAITTHPTSASVVAGAQVSFSVTATGNPAPTYQWQQNGANVPGAVSATYSFTSTSAQSGYTYRCIATNTTTTQCEAYSNAATLTVTASAGGTAPTVTSGPVSKSVAPGASVTFSISANGSPAPSFQWQENNVNIAGATSSSYSFTAASGQNGNTFRCQVNNTYGSATSGSATLTVTAAGDAPPVVSTAPTSKSTPQHTTVSFTTVASPVTSYEWYRDGLYIGAGSTFSPDVSTVGRFLYECIARNGTASTTVSAYLTVTAPADAVPVVSTYPADTTTKQFVATTMRTVASPVTSYEWYRDGLYVAAGSTISPNVNAQGTFLYECIARNNSSSSVVSASLTVTAPRNGTFPSYNNVSADVVAYGAPATWSIYSDGGTSDGGGWGNPVGGGDGNLYVHTAFLQSGAYSAVSGYGALGVGYTGAASWSQKRPVSTVPEASRFCQLRIETTLDGVIVCTHYVNLNSVNSAAP